MRLAVLRGEALVEGLARYLAGRLGDQQRIIAELMTVDSEHRLGETLLRLADQLGKHDPRSMRIAQRISHQDFSEMADGQRQRAIAAHSVIAGMAASQVREAIGEPASISPKLGQSMPTEAWVYVRRTDGSGVTGFVILRNGTVTDVELTAYEPPRAASREERRSANTQSRASERRFIDGKGLSEGELIARIGEPDRRELQAAECILPSGRTYTCQQVVWIYDPTPNDAQTRTTVTIVDAPRGGAESAAGGVPA